MRSSIPPIKPAGAAWAADNIESPFLFLPNSILAGTALGTSGLPVVSNITGCPSTFTVVDADSSADNNTGWFTQDHATVADYIWPGHADYDAESHGLYQLGNLLPTGTENGVGGKTLLVAFTLYIPTGAATSGGIMSWGYRNSTDTFDGWGFGVNLGTGALNFGPQINGAVVQADVTNASLSPRDTPIRIATLIDAQNAEVLSAVNGSAVTPAGKATIIAALDAQARARATVGFTFGGFNGAAVQGTRSLGTAVLQSRWRDMLIMDLTDYANAQADFYELADRLARAPTYSLPHWMDRF